MQLIWLSIIIVALRQYSVAAEAPPDANVQSKAELAEEHDDDYNDYVDENEANKQSRQRTQNILKRVGTSYTWDRWEKWSKCATTCVQIKRRKCIERIQNDTDATTALERAYYPSGRDNAGCLGIVKRYRLCKDERCQGNNQRLRHEQCESFNTVPYREKFYNWVGYEKEHDECTLYCRSSGSDLFIAMNQSVTDGTACNRPAVYYTHFYRRRAVCVEGICRAVHTSGSIRPATTRDSQLKCGSVLCKRVDEVFNKTKLPKGYNFVATLPIGTMNLTITLEHPRPTKNLLALKTLEDVFVINGNSRKPNESGAFEVNEDIFDYNRSVGVITAKGPLSKPMVLMLFVMDVNTTVLYHYTIPIPSAPVSEEEELQFFWDERGNAINEQEDNAVAGDGTPHIKERRRRKFAWKLLGFGECNRSCGPGMQTPIFRCVRQSPARYYSPSRCALIKKPIFSDDIYHCNRGLCPAFWRPSNFSECQCVTGSLTGVRTRRFQCMQEQFTGNVIEVSDKLCAARPELTSSCSCPPRSSQQLPKLYEGPASHTLTKVKRNLSGGRKPNAGVWLMSNWRGNCNNSACMPGAYQHRSIYCERSPARKELCDLALTPEQKRPCPEAHSCEYGIWITSEWSNCTGDCFDLRRHRAIFCLINGQVVQEAKCDKSRRPSSWHHCMRNEVNYCGPHWHYSAWSECTRSCGQGIKQRQAKCLDYNWLQNKLVDSNKCETEHEEIYDACNLAPCRDSYDPVQDDSLEEESSEEESTEAESLDANCSDRFSNCERISGKSFCEMDFYKTYCCQTCRGYH